MNVLDFIPYYPNIEDDDFVEKITKKKEFYELRLGPEEDIGKEGEPLTHQKFAELFFSPHTPFDSGLVFQGVGTGKTCIPPLIVENYMNIQRNTGEPVRRALIFVKGEELIRNFRREIAYVCTQNKYVPKQTKREVYKGSRMSDEQYVRRLNSAISQTYEIVKIETFLRNLPNEETIRRQYSNRIIVIDEAHHLRLQPKKEKRDIHGKVVEKVDLYERMHKFLHTVNSSRVLLLTATPIWDKANEIATLMNLILPLDHQMPIKKAFNKQFFDNKEKLINEEQLKSYFKGRVSFLRQATTTSRRIINGISKPFMKRIKVYPNIMGEFQSKYAEQAWKEINRQKIKVKGEEKERGTKGGTILKSARDASILVFPVFDVEGKVVGGEYGMEAFRKHCIVKRDNVEVYEFNNRLIKEELKRNLHKYAIKIASTLNEILENPNEVVFISIEFVTGSGAILLGLILQLFGMKWVKKAREIQNRSDQRRFAILTSDPQTTHQPKQIQRLLEIASSPENKYGDLLQVIIGSEKISEGVTIKNARQLHDLIAPWNIPSEDQANGRVQRFASHKAFDDPAERYIKYFRHVVVEEGTEGVGVGYPVDKGIDFEKETIDIYVYRLAERKDLRNAQIYRLIKTVAVDCAINYRRNVLENDEPGSKECDYQQCNYTCEGMNPDKSGKVWNYDIPDNELDKTTYNLFYANDKIKDLIIRITGIFRKEFILPFDFLKRKLKVPDDEEILLLRAIDILINGRLTIRNRFGFACYLKEDENYIFIDNSMNPLSKKVNNTYVATPLITDRSSFSSLIKILQLTKDKEVVERYCITEEGFEELSYTSKILLFELSYASRHNPNIKLSEKSTRLVDRILTDFEDQLYIFKNVPIHIMFTQEFSGVSYDVSAREVSVTGLMRRFNNTTKEWEYVPHLEEVEIVDRIKKLEIKSREKCLENNKYGVCGWISKADGHFRINFKRKNGKAVRGRVCKTFQVPDILEIFYNLESLPEPDEKYQELTREELLGTIKHNTNYNKFVKDKLEFKDPQEMKTKELRQFLTLLTLDKKSYCDTLEEILENKGLLETK
jgi:hypothetical protein